MSTVSNLPIPIVEGYWSNPIPLKQPHEEPLPYPIQCLPTIIRDAVTSYQAYGKQPISMIACSALANISLACQNQANVARDKFLISPISLYFLILSLSGFLFFATFLLKTCPKVCLKKLI